MKLSNASITPSIRKVHFVILLAALAIVAATVGCSKNSSAVSSSIPADASLRADASQTSTPSAEPAAAGAATNVKTSSAEKLPIPKLITYKSRDYGVSFVYPWQYSFLSARAVAEGDASLRPKSDGHDAQITLARIDIPKGFYADTDYESGYFALSLDQDLSQQECEASLVVPKDGKLGTDTINGAEFHWIETDNGGGGQAARLRQYVTFSNSTCYQFEMGVKTRNEDGLAREVDPDKVLRRLDGILRTVKILPTASPAAAEAENSTEDSEPAAHN
ncbi:MAG TPA: hypothetical protein VK699_08880 [Terriglobales bacterium]|jgi:hypothetical protein|nr:hypothetical protein [Terriglobales bacterium]